MKPRPVEEEGMWLAEQAAFRTWTELCAARAMRAELMQGAHVSTRPVYVALDAWERRAWFAWLDALKVLGETAEHGGNPYR